MKTLLCLAFLFGSRVPAFAKTNSAYILGPTISTNATTMSLGYAGTVTLAASSSTVSTPTITLNGVTGNITALTGNFGFGVVVGTTTYFSQVPWADVRAYGCKGDGVTNDYQCLQSAVNASNVAFLPCNIYVSSATIILKSSFTLVGQETNCAVIECTNNGPCLSLQNPVSSSGYGSTNIQDLTVTSSVTTVSRNKTGIELLAGGYAFDHVDRVKVSGNFIYGLVCDQCEVSDITRSIFENNLSTYAVGVWFTNGSEYRAGGATGFTNVNVVSRNQFNVPAYGIIHDGGNGFHFEYNNVNGSSEPLRFAGLTGFTIIGNSFESSTVQLSSTPLLFTSFGWNNAASYATTPIDKGPNVGGTISGNTFYAASSAPGCELCFESADGLTNRGITIAGNNFQVPLGINNPVDKIALSSSTILSNGGDAAPNSWYTWNPVFAGVAGAPTAINANYTRSGNTISGWITYNSTGSTATSFTMTLPTVAAGLQVGIGGGAASDNSAATTTPCRMDAAANSNIASFYKDWSGAAWTASGTKNCQVTFSYQSAQ